MLPRLYEGADGLQLPTYGVLVTAAFCAAFLYIHVRVRKIGVLPDKMLGAYIAAFVGGMLGARIMYVMFVETDKFLANPLSVFDLASGGFAVYGGLIGGAAAVLAWMFQAQLPIFKLGDIIVPGVILAMGIGRFACFFAGCCHGAPVPHFDGGVSIAFPYGEVWFSSGFPFLATEFHDGGVSRIEDIPLFPTQLWSAFASITVAGILTWFWDRRTFDGQVAALGLLIEPPTRIFVEAFRADHRGYVISWAVDPAIVEWLPGMSSAGTALEGPTMGITTSQFVGFCFIAAGAAIYLSQRRAGIAEEIPISDDDDLLLAADIPE